MYKHDGCGWIVWVRGISDGWTWQYTYRSDQGHTMLAGLVIYIMKFRSSGEI